MQVAAVLGPESGRGSDQGPKSVQGPEWGRGTHLEHMSFLGQEWGTVQEPGWGIDRGRRSGLEQASGRGTLLSDLGPGWGRGFAQGQGLLQVYQGLE